MIHSIDAGQINQSRFNAPKFQDLDLEKLEQFEKEFEQLLHQASSCARSETCSIETAEKYLSQIIQITGVPEIERSIAHDEKRNGMSVIESGSDDDLDVTKGVDHAENIDLNHIFHFGHAALSAAVIEVVEDLKKKIQHGHQQLWQPQEQHQQQQQQPQQQHQLQLEIPPSQKSSTQPQHQSHVLTMEQIRPIIKFTKKPKASSKNESEKGTEGKLKVINLHGLYSLVIILLTMPLWILSMEIMLFLGDNIKGFDENRSKFDYCGKIWCRVFLGLTDSYPIIDGDLDRLKVDNGDDGNRACLFVANHASFLDIAVLCTVLDPVFKFIAKDSLKDFPGVGRQLVGGEHVLIDRTNKRSQLRTFKEAISSYLQNGVPIMAFPEGRRSQDGRLLDFKGGLVSMAMKAKVPIIPLSISNTHAIMPSVGFLPVQPGRGILRVYVHDPIQVEGKSEEELAELVREALLSELPMDQHPLSSGSDQVDDED